MVSWSAFCVDAPLFEAFPTAIMIPLSSVLIYV